MLQVYFLSIVYIVISAMILLLDSYREQLAFLLRFRAALRENRRIQYIYFISGITVSVMMLFFPVAPGPMFLGDFIPALAASFQSMYFLIQFSEKNRERGLVFNGTRLEERKKNAGYASLAIALLHFIFPSFVLL